MVAVRGPAADHSEVTRSWSHVFDVFVVLGTLALFGVIAAIAKGVERL
jgi:hypothetical protein